MQDFINICVSGNSSKKLDFSDFFLVKQKSLISIIENISSSTSHKKIIIVTSLLSSELIYDSILFRGGFRFWVRGVRGGERCEPKFLA